MGFAAGVAVSTQQYSICSFLPALRSTASRPPEALIPLIIGRNAATIAIVYVATLISATAGAFIAAGVAAATGFMCGYGVAPPGLSLCLTLPQSALELSALYLAYLAGYRRGAGERYLFTAAALLIAACVVEVFITPILCLKVACMLCR